MARRSAGNTAEAEAPAEAQAQNDEAAKAQAKAEADAAEKAERERKAEEKRQAKITAEDEKIAALLRENEVDRSAVTGTGDAGRVTLKDAREFVKAKKAEERANRPKKAPLTLSQRRAVLKLADGPIAPHTDFNQLPLKHLVEVGLAQTETVTVQEPYVEVTNREVEIPKDERKEGGPTTRTEKVKEEKLRDVERSQYSLTELGIERAKELNPKWKTWKAPSTDSSTDAAAPETPAAA
jgi:pyruvate/2-oxoglutarate dehydrogenase complex dihydrolipoamide acyltransferase (E2) component